MSKKDIQQLLQECLEGYDGGLTPEECLSAYPHARVELEPLFRQALSLRVAFAASPDLEFRARAREKLLFAAGRDVSQAFAAEPDPEFVSTTRQRLLNRAGAGAQEALRDVPPPRLPFWVNARRRLLETAQAGPPPPAPAISVGMRTALSAAIVVLAMAIAGLGFFLQDSPANPPAQTALSAELDYINERLTNYEQLQARGQIVPPGEIDDLVELAERTSKLAQLYSADNAQLLAQLPSLIDRQQDLQESLLSEESTLGTTLATAQERLDEADQRVAAVDPTEASATSTDEPVAAAETPEPTTEATAEPTSTIEIPDVAIVSSSELGSRQLVYQYDPSVTLLGKRWMRVTTGNLNFVMPETWSLRNLEVDENDVTVLPTDYIFIQTDIAGIWLAISNETGEVTSIQPQATLRTAGADGEPMAPDGVIQLTGADSDWASLFNMLLSVELEDVQGLETTPATNTPEATSTPTGTKTPEATNSPTSNRLEETP